MTFPLRDYQIDAIADFDRQVEFGRRSILLYAPCGAGKTVIFSRLAEREVVRGGSVLIIAHAVELLDQASAKLTEIGLTDHGVIKAGHWRLRPDAPIQIASIQTLASRLQYLDLSRFSLIVIDECHRTEASSYQTVLQQCHPSATLLGATGTPIRLDGRPLGNSYEAMIQAITPAELRDRGFLVPMPPFVGAAPRVDGLRVGNNGDFPRGDLEKRANTVKLRGNIVRHWQEHAADRLTLAYCVHVQHSRDLTDQFLGIGARWAHVDGKTPAGERREIWDRLRKGDLHGVCNVGVAVEGVDIPQLGAIIDARPTASVGRYIQSGMRGGRPSPETGKTNCLFFDHAGNRDRHGDLYAPRRWSLDHGCERCEAGEERQMSIAVGGGIPREVEMDESVTLRPLGDVDGSRVSGGTARTRLAHTDLDKHTRFLELCKAAATHKRRPGWVGNVFKGEFHHWPSKQLQALPEYTALAANLTAPPRGRIHRAKSSSPQLEINI